MNTATDRELVITRRFDAPRQMVFDAWTDSKHLARWWGPRGFTTTTLAFDFRPGGGWRYMMHGPDGTDYPNLITYQEIVRPERIAYSHGSGEEGDQPFSVVTTFDEEGGTTLVTIRMTVQSAEARDEMIQAGAVKGANETLDRLAEYLAGERTV